MKLNKKRRGKLTGGLLFPQHDARVHSEQLSVPIASNCGFELLAHPPYSPDVAPSDYNLFPEIKKGLRGKRFQSTDDVKNHVLKFLKEPQLNNCHAKT